MIIIMKNVFEMGEIKLLFFINNGLVILNNNIALRVNDNSCP